MTNRKSSLASRSNWLNVQSIDMKYRYVSVI